MSTDKDKYKQKYKDLKESTDQRMKWLRQEVEKLRNERDNVTAQAKEREKKLAGTID